MIESAANAAVLINYNFQARGEGDGHKSIVPHAPFLVARSSRLLAHLERIRTPRGVVRCWPRLVPRGEKRENSDSPLDEWGVKSV